MFNYYLSCLIITCVSSLFSYSTYDCGTSFFTNIHKYCTLINIASIQSYCESYENDYQTGYKYMIISPSFSFKKEKLNFSLILHLDFLWFLLLPLSYLDQQSGYNIITVDMIWWHDCTQNTLSIWFYRLQLTAGPVHLKPFWHNGTSLSLDSIYISRRHSQCSSGSVETHRKLNWWLFLIRKIQDLTTQDLSPTDFRHSWETIQ